MNRILRAALAAAALVALAAGAALAAGELPPPTPNRAHMDTTCSPCKDFYRYANGTWLDTAEIPPSYSAIGAGREMADRNQAALYRVLEHMKDAAPTQEDPTLRKLGNLYAVLMDSTRADREGLAPFEQTKQRLAAVRSIADVQREFAHASLIGVGAGMWGGGGIPFRFGAEPDPKQSTSTIAQITQGGLGLPDRDWYFRQDEKSETIRREYVAFMGRMFALAGDDEAAAKQKADAVFALETALAESSLTNVQMRDPKALYNKITVERLAAMAPAMDWKAYFSAHGLKSLAKPGATLDVSMPGFVRQVDALLGSTPVDTWRAYLLWNHLRSRAVWMGQNAFDEVFAFQSKLTGSKAPEPRWRRANQACDRSMGEALGKAYVEEHFPASSKKRMLELVDNLQAAFAERIESRPWMSAETRKQAHRKLSTIVRKIGYPDKWRDYSRLDIDPALPAVVNLERARAFERAYELSWIGKPIDRTLWGMTPPTVNAYYNPTFNEIVFPAGILTPPQFDPRVDDAINYGAIGMVIGHEITHGFDDEGRQYDADGNLRDWWTKEDSDRFDALAHKVVEQYDAYVAVDTLRLNGKLTLGENIADLGGLTIAYHAWKRSLKGRPAPVIDGFTGEQRFFLGMAQAWRRKFRPEMLRMQALSDPHSTAYWRVNGPLSNMTEFRQAFGCKDGDPMVRAEQFVIW
jgi:predicted metalloendopeptidase